MRLAKYLAHCGVASRRRAEELIAAGRVTVGGRSSPTRRATSTRTATSRSTAGPSRPSRARSGSLNKPAGVVSTAREPGRRPAVVELVDSARRLYPVGRLDADSTGLILLTNDGELANRLTHPRYGVERRPTGSGCAGPRRESQLRRLRDGRRARRRADRPGAACAAVSPRVLEMTLARGPQPPGAADGRGGRQPGRGAGAGPRSARWRSATSPEGEVAAAAAAGGEAALEGCRADESTSSDCGRCGAPSRCDSNDADAILGATEELMRELMSRNELEPERIVSCLFTATDDLNAEFPAVAARAPRPRRGAAALRPRDRRARARCAGDPGPGPLLRARPTTSRARLPGRGAGAARRPPLRAVAARPIAVDR